MKKEDNFPRDLLTRPLTEQSDYFRRYTVAHPLLVDSYNAMVDAISEPVDSLLVFLYGPAGSGKTTLFLKIQNSIKEKMKKELEEDRERIPVVAVEADGPETGNFDWRDFYRRMLTEMAEPCVENKVRPPEDAERMWLTLHRARKPTQADLRYATEQALRIRRPLAILIDEAQHLAKIASGRKTQDQLDAIKSLANKPRIPIVLFGTYELLSFRNLSAQLTRRSVDVHCRRYNSGDADDIYAFKKCSVGVRAPPASARAAQPRGLLGLLLREEPRLRRDPQTLAHQGSETRANRRSEDCVPGTSGQDSTERFTVPEDTD
ncbi:MAG: ATPase [Acidobacteria bacterium]|nr:ATPase [Acidobacteriota bacterium]